MTGVLLKPEALETETPLEAEQLNALPIFPLGNAVFFPWTLMPLYIFEPRYRALTRFCIENNWPLAIGGAKADDEDEEGLDVQRIMGVGDIIHHEEHEDGTFHIVVRCLGRVEILEEVESVEGYRRVRAEKLEDHPVEDTKELDDTIVSIQGCLNGLQGILKPDILGALRRWSNEAGSPEAVTFGLCSVVLHSPPERQGALEEVSTLKRAQSILDQLTELMLRGVPDASPEELN